MWFTGQRRQGGGDIVDGGFDVGHGGVLVVCFIEVAGIGMGHGEAEIAFQPT